MYFLLKSFLKYVTINVVIDVKKVVKILISIIEVLIIVYVIAITVSLLNKNKYGYTVFGDKTLVTINENNTAELDSFKKGDLVIIDKVTFNDVEVGDTLYYYDVANQTYILKTGVVKEKNGDNASAIYVMDDSKTLSSEKIVGEYNDVKYSSFGKVLDILESRFGFLLLVILPVFVLFIYQVYKMILLLKDGSDSEPVVKTVKAES